MVVYLVENLINGKKYIGMDTHNNPKYLGSGTLITKALKKYGKENFKKSILEHCSSIEELEIRETWWINYFNALESKDFYNLEDNKKRGINPFANKTEKELREIFNKVKSEERNEKIGKSNSKPKPKGFGEKIKKIHQGRKRSEESKFKQSKVLKGRTSPNKGNKWNEDQKKLLGKPILQYDINNKLIKEWYSTQEAQNQLGIKGINNNLKGRTKTCGGFIWKYKNN
jgi:group I intron endonuclease